MFFDDDDYTIENEERLVQSTKGEYDVEENVLRPKTLDAYVGQSKVKENLTVYMNAAKKRGEEREPFYPRPPGGEERCTGLWAPRAW